LDLTKSGPTRRLGIALVAVVAAGVLPILSPGARVDGTNQTGGAPSSTTHCPASTPTAYGAPAWTLCDIGEQGFTSPVGGTIDGEKVVVVGSLSGWLYVVNAKTGAELPGWPQPANLVGSTHTAIDSSPAIAYLDGPNRQPSIVVGLGSLYDRAQNGGVMAWNANGSVRFRFVTKKTFAEWRGYPNDYSDAVFATPAIGDVTGSGQQDIVFGSFDHYVYALGPSGRVLPGFPINRADTIWSSPALADVSHTGVMDIIEGGDATGWQGPSGGPRCYNGWISDYRYLFGAPRLVWERCVGETVWSSPAVTTFGTTPVVVAGTSWFYGPGRTVLPAEQQIYAWNAATGATMPGWPVTVHNPKGGPAAATFGSPAVGPLVDGGGNAVVESSCAHCTSGPSLVTAWTQTGHQLWQTEVSPGSQLIASPSIVDVAGSATNDVLIGNAAGLFVLNALTGQKVESTGLQPINSSCNVEGTPVTMAVPGSATGYMMFTNCGFKGPGVPVNTYLRGYAVPAPPADSHKASGISTALPWPMFRANPQRTGVPDPNGVTAARCSRPRRPNGYRVVAAGGAVYGFGASARCGDLSQQIVPGRVAGVASTPDGGGYWLALQDGAVYAFGDAKSYGDLRDADVGGRAPNAAPGAPITSISSTPDGKGYYLLAGDGSVYTFGDARFAGSEGGWQANGVPIAIATDDATGGYWIVTTTGHVYNFDARFLGSKTTGHRSPIVGIGAQPSGTGYWLVTQSGYVYGFGTAPLRGQEPGVKTVGITVPVSGRGYYLLDAAGRVRNFWHAAPFHSPALSADPVVGISAP
jgi:hypothetical protein